jgi:hypothetical protein
VTLGGSGLRLVAHESHRLEWVPVLVRATFVAATLGAAWRTRTDDLLITKTPRGLPQRSDQHPTNNFTCKTNLANWAKAMADSMKESTPSTHRGGCRGRSGVIPQSPSSSLPRLREPFSPRSRRPAGRLPVNRVRHLRTVSTQTPDLPGGGLVRSTVVDGQDDLRALTITVRGPRASGPSRQHDPLQIGQDNDETIRNRHRIFVTRRPAGDLARHAVRAPG